jgi:uncharacterized peroxidase-related enzyme
MIYQDPDVARTVGEDPLAAPIPDLHKAVFRFAEKFVKSSWRITAADLDSLRDAGASERDVAEWLQNASIQTWFTHSADAGGIPLEGNAVTGPVLNRSRDQYHSTRPAAGDPDPPLPVAKGAWLQSDRASEHYAAMQRWADTHLGFVPGMFDAISACPDFYARHQLALELLEQPQSTSLSPSLHSLVRAAVVAIDHCAYFEPTVGNRLSQHVEGDVDIAGLVQDPATFGDDSRTQTVLQFACKMATTPYKITDRDAEGFRAVGLTDETYVDVFNTVAIQQSLDRLANSCGANADSQPLRISV